MAGGPHNMGHCLRVAALGRLRSTAFVHHWCYLRWTDVCSRYRKSDPTLQKLDLHSQVNGQECGFAGSAQNWSVRILQVCISLIFLYVCDLVLKPSEKGRKHRGWSLHPVAEENTESSTMQRDPHLYALAGGRLLFTSVLFYAKCLPSSLYFYCRELFVLPLWHAPPSLNVGVRLWLYSAQRL